MVLSLQMSGCRSAGLGVTAVPQAAMVGEQLSPGPHLYLVNDHPGFAEVYLVLNGSRVLVARVAGGSRAIVAIPPDLVGRPARVLVEPGMGQAFKTSRELTLLPQVNLEVRTSQTRLCVRAWTGGDVCP